MQEGSTSSAGQLLISAAIPVIQICLIASIGAIMVRKGLFDSAACTVLARANICIFIPALTFSKLASSVTTESVPFLWPLVVNMALDVSVGLAVGWAIARLLRCPAVFRPHVQCCVAFGNVGNLPLVFVAALCHDPHTVFHRVLRERCEHLGISYIAVSIFGATFLQFTIAIRLLKPPVPPPDGDNDSAVEQAAEVTNGGLSGQNKEQDEGTIPAISHSDAAIKSSGHGGSSRLPVQEEPEENAALAMLHHQDLDASIGSSIELPPILSRGSSYNTATMERVIRGQSFQRALIAGSSVRDLGSRPDIAESTVRDVEQGEEQESSSLLGHGGLEQQAESIELEQPRRRMGKLLWQLWSSIRLLMSRLLAMPAPAQAAVLGVVVGCIGPVRDLLYPSVGASAPPLFFLSDMITTVSGAMIPCAIILLGAVLYRTWQDQGGTLPTRVVVGTILSRLVIMPALLTPLIMLAVKLRIVVVLDPLFLFCLLAVHASPTAINMQTMTVLYKHGEAEISTVLFWSYIGAIITLPAWTWLFLKIITGMDDP